MKQLCARLRSLRRRATPAHLRTGAGGEKTAARFLRSHGYKVLARNLRTPVGEADLICLAPDRRTVVVVEVKTRTASPGSDRPHVAPELAVNAAKRRKLLAVTQDLIRRRGWRGRTVRIDIVAIDVDARGKPTIRHHINAVHL
ncbi:MAG: YraN family protein [Phycisphaerales bacterium]